MSGFLNFWIFGIRGVNKACRLSLELINFYTNSFSKGNGWKLNWQLILDSITYFLFPDTAWPQSLGSAGVFQIRLAGLWRGSCSICLSVSRVKWHERAGSCPSFCQAGLALYIWLVLYSLWWYKSSAGQEPTFPFLWVFLLAGSPRDAGALQVWAFL